MNELFESLFLSLLCATLEQCSFFPLPFIRQVLCVFSLSVHLFSFIYLCCSSYETIRIEEEMDPSKFIACFLSSVSFDLCWFRVDAFVLHSLRFTSLTHTPVLLLSFHSVLPVLSSSPVAPLVHCCVECPCTVPVPGHSISIFLMSQLQYNRPCVVVFPRVLGENFIKPSI